MDLMSQLENHPAISVTKAVLRAAFLLGNGPNRPQNAVGMNVSQVDVLRALARAGDSGLKCSDIADATLVTKGGITGVLDRLEARGLVRRVHSREDRRSIMVQLTEKGVEFCEDFFPRMARSDQETFGKALSPEQSKQLSRLMSLLLRSLEEDAASRNGNTAR